MAPSPEGAVIGVVALAVLEGVLPAVFLAMTWKKYGVPSVRPVAGWLVVPAERLLAMTVYGPPDAVACCTSKLSALDEYPAHDRSI